MRIAELLQAMASWLESPDNEALLLAESDEECSRVVAESCVLASALLKNAAEEVDRLEPQEPSKITPEALDELAALANAFDASGDERLKKQASVLDELLMSIAAPPNAYAERKDLQENRILDLQKKYNEPRDELRKINSTEQSEKAIDKSDITKDKYRPLEAGLLSRYCPDHAGVQMMRIGESLYACEMDKKQYDFENGYTLNSGVKVPGSNVSNQTQPTEIPYHSIFDTREGRLGSNQ